MYSQVSYRPTNRNTKARWEAFLQTIPYALVHSILAEAWQIYRTRFVGMMLERGRMARSAEHPGQTGPCVAYKYLAKYWFTLLG